MSCPIDGKTFTAPAISAYVIRAVRLDLKPLGALIAPNPLPVCPENGFVVYKKEFTPAEIAAIKPIVLSPDYRQLRDDHTDYYMAAYVKERVGADDYDIGQTYLQASWEAERDRPQSVVYHYRSLALGKPDAFLKQDHSRSEQWWTASLLVGELERMLGHFDAAEARLKALPYKQAKATLGEKGAALARAAEQIRLHARSRNAAPEFYSDLVGRGT